MMSAGVKQHSAATAIPTSETRSCLSGVMRIFVGRAAWKVKSPWRERRPSGSDPQCRRLQIMFLIR